MHGQCTTVSSSCFLAFIKRAQADRTPVVELTRSTLFDLQQSHVGRNFGVLFVWVAIDTLLFPACCYFMRWNTARVKRNAVQAEAEWHAKMEKERDEPSLMARVTTRGSRWNGGASRDAERG